MEFSPSSSDEIDYIKLNNIQVKEINLLVSFLGDEKSSEE